MTIVLKGVKIMFSIDEDTLQEPQILDFLLYYIKWKNSLLPDLIFYTTV